MADSTRTLWLRDPAPALRRAAARTLVAYFGDVDADLAEIASQGDRPYFWLCRRRGTILVDGVTEQELPRSEGEPAGRPQQPWRPHPAGLAPLEWFMEHDEGAVLYALSARGGLVSLRELDRSRPIEELWGRVAELHHEASLKARRAERAALGA